MILNNLVSLKKKLTSKEAGKVSIDFNTAENSLILSSVLIQNRNIFLEDIKTFITKKSRGDLFVDRDKRLVIRKKFPIQQDGTHSFRHLYREFACRVQQLLEEIEENLHTSYLDFSKN